jgi:hypothetical protein
MTVHQAKKVHFVSDVGYKVGPRLPCSIQPLCVKDGNVQEHWRAAQTVDLSCLNQIRIGRSAIFRSNGFLTHHGDIPDPDHWDIPLISVVRPKKTGDENFMSNAYIVCVEELFGRGDPFGGLSGIVKKSSSLAKSADISATSVRPAPLPGCIHH